jgi:uncharacterized protein (TIGR04255 family)
MARFYDAVKGTFDGETAMDMIQQNVLTEDRQQIRLSEIPLPRYTFENRDATLSCRIGKEFISLHALRPYKGWASSFRPVIYSTLEAFDAIGGKLSYHQVGIRYVNTIAVDALNGITPSSLFNLPIQLPGGLNGSVVSSISQSHLIDKETNILTTLIYAITANGDSMHEVTLDLSVTNHPANESLFLSDALQKVEFLRIKEREAFELCITDQLRRVMDDRK